MFRYTLYEGIISSGIDVGLDLFTKIPLNSVVSPSRCHKSDKRREELIKTLIYFNHDRKKPWVLPLRLHKVCGTLLVEVCLRHR